MLPKNEVMTLQRNLKVVDDGVIGITTYTTLFAKLGANPANARALAYAANVHLDAYGFNSSLELCHFLGQAVVETDSFNTFVEYGGSSYFAKYEPGTPVGKDLGNLKKGDGELYKGRGIFQLTGLGNYTLYSKRMGIDFISNPQHVAIPEISFNVACRYWSDRGIRQFALADKVSEVTRKINGGQNHLNERIAATLKVKKLFGLA